MNNEERSCSNCKHQDKNVDQVPCINCIHNSIDNFEKKPSVIDKANELWLELQSLTGNDEEYEKTRNYISKLFFSAELGIKNE